MLHIDPIEVNPIEAWCFMEPPAGHSTVYLYEGDNILHLRSIQQLQADVCITSPPYFKKFDYGIEGQLGLEATVEEYLRTQVSVFHQVQRLLCEGGTCFIVIGDTSNNYSPIRAKSQRKSGDKQWHSRRSLEDGYREKEILNVPLRLAEALRQDGWIHRSTMIWDKGGGSTVSNSDTAPECHEYILHMIKWTPKKRPYGNTRPLRSSVLRHHAAAHPQHGCVFPVGLVTELLSVVCPRNLSQNERGGRGKMIDNRNADGLVIIDPYMGSGTVALAAAKSSPNSVVYGFDLNCSIARAAIPHAIDGTSARVLVPSTEELQPDPHDKREDGCEYLVGAEPIWEDGG